MAFIAQWQSVNPVIWRSWVQSPVKAFNYSQFSLRQAAPRSKQQMSKWWQCRYKFDLRNSLACHKLPRLILWHPSSSHQATQTTTHTANTTKQNKVALSKSGFKLFFVFHMLCDRKRHAICSVPFLWLFAHRLSWICFARRQNKSATTPVAIGILRRCFPTTLDMWFGLELGSIVSHEDCTTDTPVEDNSKKCRFAICWESVMPRERLQCGAVSSRLRVVSGCFNPTILTQ